MKQDGKKPEKVKARETRVPYYDALELLFPELRKTNSLKLEDLRTLYLGRRAPSARNDVLGDLDRVIGEIIADAGADCRLTNPYSEARLAIAWAFAESSAQYARQRPLAKHRDKLQKRSEKFRSQAIALEKLFSIEPVRYAEQLVSELRRKKGKDKQAAEADARRKRLWDAGNQVFKAAELVPRAWAVAKTDAGKIQTTLELAGYHVDKIMQAVEALNALAVLAEAEIVRLDAALARKSERFMFAQALGLVYSELSGDAPPISKERSSFSDFVDAVFAIFPFETLGLDTLKEVAISIGESQSHTPNIKT